MLIETITSRQNPLVKRFIAARQGRERHIIFVEGIRLVEEAVRATLHIEAVAYSNALFDQERGTALLEKLKTLPCRGALVTEKLMNAITSVETPQGVVMMVARPHYNLEDLLEPSPQLLVLADGLQDPGNIGALVRTGEAAGITGLIATRQTVDPFQSKSLRASAGSSFRVPIATHQSSLQVFEKLRSAGIRVVTADAHAPLHFAEYDWRQPTALWLGSEGNGLLENSAVKPDASVFIPMAGQLESLNIAVASALLLYEAARQRQIQT